MSSRPAYKPDTAHEAVQTDNTVTFTHTGHPSFGGTLTQVFELGDFLLTDVRITDKGETVSTNRIAPLTVYEGGLGDRQNGVFVQIPGAGKPAGIPGESGGPQQPDDGGPGEQLHRQKDSGGTV